MAGKNTQDCPECPALTRSLDLAEKQAAVASAIDERLRTMEGRMWWLLVALVVVQVGMLAAARLYERPDIPGIGGPDVSTH